MNDVRIADEIRVTAPAATVWLAIEDPVARGGRDDGAASSLRRARPLAAIR